MQNIHLYNVEVVTDESIKRGPDELKCKLFTQCIPMEINII